MIDARISGTQSAMILMAFRSVVTCPGYCSLAVHLSNARPTFFDLMNGLVLWSDIVYIHTYIVAFLLLTGIGAFPFAASHFFLAWPPRNKRFTN